jgi:drug/metabolite transporter (DMT)-like permease
MSQPKAVSWLLFILLSLIWGSAFIIMKVSTKHLTGSQIAAIRIFSAGAVFLPFAVFHLRQIPRNKLGYVILSALLGNLFPAFLFAIAIENKVNSSMAGILNSLTPLFVISIGAVFFHAKAGKRKVTGVLIGFAGLLALTFSKGGVSFDNYGSILLILLATLLYGINVNLVSHFLKNLDPIKMATVSLAFMCLPTALVLWRDDVYSMAMYDEAARLSILATVLLGVVGSAIATALFYILIRNAGGLFASLVTYAIPVVAIIWGLWAGEEVTIIQVSCLIVILSGVYLANK